MIEALLAPFQVFGVHLGLERSERLLERLGNPHDRVPVVHVAGTNGKGSVCAYLSAILTAAGYCTGRYTSPHLVDWTERICVNEVAIAPADLTRWVECAIAAIDPTQPELRPTVFEIVTAAAWLYFAEQQVEVAIVEVGLGGRLDATNVCAEPLVTVITALSREHWQRLGPTLADIAREKAGILKPGCPAVIAPLPPEAAPVVEARLQALNCPTYRPPSVDPSAIPGWGIWEPWGPEVAIPLPLPGAAQRQNLALALQVVEILRTTHQWQISEDAIATGLSQTRWPGRLQWLTWQGQDLLIDGAHNPAAAQVLRAYLDTLPPQPTQWFIGMLNTKDHRDVLAALLRSGDRVVFVPVPDHATEPPESLDSLARSLPLQLAASTTAPSLKRALTTCWPRLDGYRPVLCGSLYLLGHFLRELA